MRDFANVADFLSLGTNDLTQFFWALDRDSGAVTIVEEYAHNGLLKESPFRQFDFDGLGQLLATSIKKTRKRFPRMDIGVTGEFGAQPSLWPFWKRVGVSYIGAPLDVLRNIRS